MPLLVRVSLLHTLNLSETSAYNDLRSVLTVAFLRAFIAPKARGGMFTRTQNRSLPQLPVKGRLWISKYTTPQLPDPASLKLALAKAIETLNNPDVPAPVLDMPEAVPVYSEWTGYRADAKEDESLPDISEQDKYAEMMKEVKAHTTVLYFHGGGHALMDPATHRSTVKKLAKITGGRAFSVRYRLVPQNPFPSALLDCFVAYLALLYPPPGSWHEPVKPEHIVFAGDSAGGNLAMSLLQVVVELNRLGQRILWHGKECAIPIPAAVACNSPWLDLSHSSEPFYGKRPATFDYLGPPGNLGRKGLKPCAIWPASPPRKYMYAADDLMTHPLRLAYEDKFVAQKLEGEGVTVVFEEYESMPHCFALVLTGLPESRRCLDGWAGFIRQAVEDPEGLRSRSTTIHAKTLEETCLKFEDLCDVSDDVVRKRVVDTVAEIKAWIPTEEAKL
ncbi:hypothetical protein UVI_02013900 [Ustilaginoidea virens]|uniref:Alpha/beta hydrolase fold-3 domain-containing protein n=1 Tax=Ustilaginoidea virens TaxID=1159556 RepID=A0A1B5KRJ0_USTVR|nr:hypothetical protein UVI_02013900 [Ustilaginoidea virens]